jgi:mRNA interferase MazF
MPYSFGDVILVPFPFTNQLGVKRRPAVVVSSNNYNTSRRDLVIMSITSQIRILLAFGEAFISDWQTTGLIKASVLKPVFTTLEQGLVIRTLGVLTIGDLQQLRKVLAMAIG